MEDCSMTMCPPKRFKIMGVDVEEMEENLVVDKKSPDQPKGKAYRYRCAGYMRP